MGVISNSSPGTAINRFQPVDYLKITIFGFALSALWSSLHTIIMPLRLLEFVPESLKNTYLDLLVLIGLILAMAVQPIAGAISDRSSFGWGRRRPYILLGGLLILLLLPGIGFCGSYVTIFIVYCLLQISSNTAQGPFQGFIPDLVPEGRRGTASGVRGFLNLLGGVTLIRLIAPLMDRYLIEHEISGLWLTLSVLAIILLGVMLATVITVKERPGTGGPKSSLMLTLHKSFMFDIKTRPDFMVFLVACFLIFMAWGTLMAHALYFLMDVVEVPGPAAATSNLLIVVAVCLLAVVYPAGNLCDKVGRKPIAVSSGLLGALGIVALYFSAFLSQNYIYIMFSGGILGICGGAWVSTQWALATDLVSKGEEARYLGLVNMSIASAGALSRLVGPAIDFFNTISLNLGYSAMLLVCFFCFIAGSLLLLKIKERKLTPSEIG